MNVHSYTELWSEGAKFGLDLNGVNLSKCVHGRVQCPLTHGLSQDLETKWPKLAIATFLGIQILKGDHNILIFLP